MERYEEGIRIRPIRFLYWLSIAWVIVALASLLASAPFAWRVLMTGSLPVGREALILAWDAVLVVLSIPAGIAIIYCRNQMRKDKEFQKWIREDISAVNLNGSRF